MRARAIAPSVTLAAVVIVASLLGAGTASAAQYDTVLASRVGTYGAGANGFAGGVSISADGRHVAFSSDATNLDPADADTTSDVFVRDLVANTTRLVSRANGAGGAKGNSMSSSPSVSADGRFVSFTSTASNLDPADADTTSDVFVRDLVANTTTLVSRANGAGGAKGTGSSFTSSISADGSSVAFASSASNLDPADADTTLDVYVRDFEADTTVLVSRSTSGAKANAGSGSPSISATGRFVAFGSNASNLDPADPDGTADIFVRDVSVPQTTLVSRADGLGGIKSNGISQAPSISADGRFVAFNSHASNLDPADTDGPADIFVRDLVAHTTTLGSRASGVNGAKGNVGGLTPSISADGRYVAFWTFSTNLDPADTDATGDIHVRDLVSNTTALVSRASGATGAKGNAESRTTSVSANGRFIAFSGFASNLHPEDTDSDSDVFVRDVLGPQVPPGLAINNVSAKEGKSGSRAFTFTVTLKGIPGRTVTVDFATQDGSATTDDNDYEFANGTLSFAPGETTKQIAVTVNGDKKKEKTEVFEVRLFDATGAQIEDGSGLGTIKRDEKKRR